MYVLTPFGEGREKNKSERFFQGLELVVLETLDEVHSGYSVRVKQD